MYPNSSEPSNLPDKHQAHQPAVIMGILKDLNQHSNTVKGLAYGESHMYSMFIKGHLEAHYEKIDDLKMKLSGIMSIQSVLPKSTMVMAGVASTSLSDAQALKVLRRNIHQLTRKVQLALKDNNKPLDEVTTLWLKELKRKLRNDLSRTTYFLQ